MKVGSIIGMVVIVVGLLMLVTYGRPAEAADPSMFMCSCDSSNNLNCYISGSWQTLGTCPTGAPTNPTQPSQPSQSETPNCKYCTSTLNDCGAYDDGTAAGYMAARNCITQKSSQDPYCNACNSVIQTSGTTSDQARYCAACVQAQMDCQNNAAPGTCLSTAKTSDACTKCNEGIGSFRARLIPRTGGQSGHQMNR